MIYFSRKNKELKERQALLLARQEKEVENVFLKLESLRSQMNPHFIFNALNSIQDYILKNEKRLARDFLVKFSRLIRTFLEHSQKDLITLEEELSVLKLYLELEKDRFEHTFHYFLEVDKKLDKQSIEIPTFLIQPYIENAIKHGLLHLKGERLLHVRFIQNDDSKYLLVEIEDNGVGREASKRINDRKPLKPKSFSTKANQKRVELINKTREVPIELVIQDLFNEDRSAKGTIVKIKIPL